MKKYIYLFLGLSLYITACSSDNETDLNPNLPTPIDGADVVVQNFMWQAMNFWYFFQDDVGDLADNRFASDEEFTAFLEANPNPSDFFFNVLQAQDDRFSFISEDFRTIVNSQAGISRSNGLEFGLVRFTGTQDIFGYVRYIIPNSDASTKDIQRGDLFTQVDGTLLTDQNFRDLLFGENNTYTLTLADLENGVVNENGREVTLTKQEGLVENPIFINTTLNVSGQNIGYLMYNGFTRNFDEQLNNAFGEFVADGVTDLIVDFRYNPGGSVNTSRLLASMIAGTNTNDLYLRQRWNTKQQERIPDDVLDDFFAETTNSGTPINTLNLNRVFILTSSSTASSSELVINGLAPYVDIIQIGETTTGKNEFSITLVDDPNNGGIFGPFVYNPNRENQINTENSWGLQPLVGRNENADGFFEYTDGLAPNIVLEEDLSNLGILGDINEPLLARALQEITGTSSAQNFISKGIRPIEKITNSKMHTPLKDNMYLDKPLGILDLN